MSQLENLMAGKTQVRQNLYFFYIFYETVFVNFTIVINSLQSFFGFIMSTVECYEHAFMVCYLTYSTMACNIIYKLNKY